MHATGDFLTTRDWRSQIQESSGGLRHMTNRKGFHLRIGRSYFALCGDQLTRVDKAQGTSCKHLRSADVLSGKT